MPKSLSSFKITVENDSSQKEFVISRVPTKGRAAQLIREFETQTRILKVARITANIPKETKARMGTMKLARN